MKKKQLSQFPKTAVIAVVAVVLVGGSFAMASGAIAGPSSLMASALAALTGKPTILLGRDGASPAGSIKMGVNQTLAVFDIKANNTTNWATLHATGLQVVVTSSAASPISVGNLSASYHYCIPAGAIYGYGWKGGSCGTIPLGAGQPSATTNQGTTVVNFYSNLPIYPENSYGAITITGTPNYQYTGAKTLSGSGNGTLQVKVSSMNASGDQCKTTPTYGYTDGHKWGIIGSAMTGCVSYNAIVNIQAGSGNVLTIGRPYGYGYNPLTSAQPVISSFTASPTTILPGGHSVLMWSASNMSNCTIYYLKNGQDSVFASNVGLRGVYGVVPTTTTTYELQCFISTAHFIAPDVTVTVAAK